MRRSFRVVLFLAAVVAVVVAVRLLPVTELLTGFTAWVRGTGAAGYVIYVFVYAICCVALIPASALSLGAGAIFGVVGGTVVVVLGATLGATAAFLLGRTLLRHHVEKMIAARPNAAAIDRALAAEGTKIMLLMRVSGFPPFTWINYALSASGVRLVPYVLTTFFGIIPGAIAFTWAGAAGAAALTGSGNRLLLIATAVGAILVTALIARVAARAIRRAGVAQ